MLGYAGYFGILAGLWSRRATVVVVSAAGLVLLVGLSDTAYLAFDLAPGQGTARLGTERLAQIARPFVVAAGAYGISVFARSAISAWNTGSVRQRLVAAALLGIMAGAVVRVAPGLWWNGVQRASNDTRVYALQLDHYFDCAVRRTVVRYQNFNGIVEYLNSYALNCLFDISLKIETHYHDCNSRRAAGRFENRRGGGHTVSPNRGLSSNKYKY